MKKTLLIVLSSLFLIGVAALSYKIYNSEQAKCVRQFKEEAPEGSIMAQLAVGLTGKSYNQIASEACKQFLKDLHKDGKTFDEYLKEKEGQSNE